MYEDDPAARRTYSHPPSTGSQHHHLTTHGALYHQVPSTKQPQLQLHYQVPSTKQPQYQPYHQALPTQYQAHYSTPQTYHQVPPGEHDCQAPRNQREEGESSHIAPTCPVDTLAYVCVQPRVGTMPPLKILS